MAQVAPVQERAPRKPAVPRQLSFTPPLIRNPFIHDPQLTAAEKLKMVVLGIILFPIRLVCLLIILMMIWPFVAVVTACCPLKGSQPFIGWRRTLIHCCIGSLTRALFFSMGFVVKVKGKRASQLEAPLLVVAPHSTFFDAIACIVAGLPSPVSRTENVAIPIFGRMLRATQPVLVSRIDPDSRKRTANEIIKRVTSDGEWPQVLIFPEGTCSNRSCLITFRLGAFSPGVPVQPVLLRYPNKVFMPVHFPNEEEKKDPLLFANGVRSAMAAALGVPITDHTYEDCRLMVSAGELTLPMETGLVEFTKVSRKLNLKWDNIRQQLNEFAEIASASKGGRIRIEEFAKFLKIPVSDVVKELFALFDRNGDGTIDFREYVIGMTIVCNPVNTEETIMMAFKLFDIDEDGSITEAEFTSLLQSSLGVHDIDVSKIFNDMDTDGSGTISYSEFRDFALKHPVYAKLFTTYLDQQRYYMNAEKEEFQDTLPQIVSSKIHSESNEDSLSTSDKKDD
ncbi:lysophosphatidylcholine acyltransferase 2 isoform X2 [Rhinatrema bivittatum]|uniref:lysophosphatidylcholine acyltransferase 2-like isoform X2 n=1 Tax=Rhinatrema bivittatum TaxID=194408 RepID=UPI00112BE2CA|nr:lysophosphatidylcholine acyltransferase 2-like isoform X2 [Rhinatrema bivittatum]XP_029464435.1 lysophosphatidylcholine acyltransferase 2 isoform X2 [Rhinatrema bivittatum]